MKDIILDIISRRLGIEKEGIGLDADLFDELGADSLDAVDMLIELEETIGSSIPDEDAIELRTVRKISDYTENIK